MNRRTITRPGAIFGAAALTALALLSVPLVTGHADSAPRTLPPPAIDVPQDGSGLQTAVFGGGCFWGVQGVFQHVQGVTEAVSGYTGGQVANPGYELVSSGTTGHAESVRVTFDPAHVSYGRLLQIFFSVALDPTQVDGQGPDWGTQYRSELFVTTPQQDHVARAYLAQLQAAHVFSRPIATRIDPAGAFYPAEAYHQDYLTRHPDAMYIATYDIPKVRNLQALFPQNWQDAPVMVVKSASGS
ncbi:MAG TPA: peptide-methionine (S)-S-oxide reductase MsrA [Acetobacteraceae bacterium]